MGQKKRNRTIQWQHDQLASNIKEQVKYLKKKWSEKPKQTSENIPSNELEAERTGE